MSPEYSFGPPEPRPESESTPDPATEPAAKPVPEPEPEEAPRPEPENEPVPAAPDSGEYRFVYGYPTTYPELGLTFEPGDVHDWPDGPPTDGRWTPATVKEQ